MCDAESLFNEGMPLSLHRPYWAGGAIVAALADETRAPSNMRVVSGMARHSFMEGTYDQYRPKPPGSDSYSSSALRCFFNPRTSGHRDMRVREVAFGDSYRSSQHHKHADQQVGKRHRFPFEALIE